MDIWTHTLEVDYDWLPSKCKVFHEDGHFVRCCKMKQEDPQNQGNEGEEL